MSTQSFPAPLAHVVEQHENDPKQVAFMLKEASVFIRENCRPGADSETKRALEDDLNDLAAAFEQC